MLPADIKLHTPVNVGFWVLSSQYKQPQVISEVAPEAGMFNNEYQVSPDGRWVSFVRQSIDDDFLTLLISSLDGQQLWSVRQIAKDSYSLWIAEQEILIFETENNYENLVIVNPFTLEEKVLSPLPERESDWYYYYHFRSNGNFYTLYVDALIEGYTYFLFDHTSNTKWKAFPWLDPLHHSETNIWPLADSTFVITVERSYGFDISSSLDVETLHDDHPYDEVMRQVRFSEEILPLEVWRVTSETGLAIVVKKEVNIDLSTPIAEYVMDIESMILQDYCINQFVGEWNILSISPDGRFAELGYEEPDRASRGTAILNLETGYIALIDGYQLLGWGIDDAQ